MYPPPSQLHAATQAVLSRHHVPDELLEKLMNVFIRREVTMPVDLEILLHARGLYPTDPNAQ